uniref:SET domain-containing protein n=1 Tax=Scophthalmus maximus TaxID=52904 RepID=A0A8D3B5C6_SCOMX
MKMYFYLFCLIGRGVFARGSFCQRDFVLEYRGAMINNAEYQRRRRIYHPSCNWRRSYIYVKLFFSLSFCFVLTNIDASGENHSFGRLVNDEHRHPNCRMKRIDVDGNPHLCLFALNDISEGEEITYDYGGGDCPWRTQRHTWMKPPVHRTLINR